MNNEITFNEWIDQFISAKGRGTGKHLGKKFICVKNKKKTLLYLDTPSFNEWLDEKKEIFEGLKHLQNNKI